MTYSFSFAPFSLKRKWVSKACLVFGFCLIFWGFAAMAMVGAWSLQADTTIVSSTQLEFHGTRFTYNTPACGIQSRELKEVAGVEEEASALFEVPPVALAPTDLHRYADLNKTFYLTAAYHEPRFFPYNGASPEERLILLILADENMRSWWKAWNMPVQDGWNCLLCSFLSEIETEGVDFHGPPPSMKFEPPGAEPLNCWWASAANRSYQWLDLHDKNYNLGQFECLSPEGVPLDKISLATLAHQEWANTHRLEDVIFAPLETMLAGIRRAAVPSYERFKRVHHMKYVERAGDVTEAPAGSAASSEEKPSSAANSAVAAKPRFSLCVGPVHSDGVPYVEEWVAFNQMMGVDHFHVYYWDNPVKATSPLLLKKLNYYAARGIMTIYHLDMEFEDKAINKTGLQARPKAQATVVMDCYYRASVSADFVGWMDMDEFLAPTDVTKDDWAQALDPLIKDPTLGTFKFPHWWFRTENRIVAGSESGLHTELVTASVFSKDVSPLGYDDYARTKCIARVGSVRMQAIHMPVDPVPGFRFENVSADIMFFRHYRGPGFLETKASTDLDTSLMRFQDKLHVVVEEIREDFLRWGVV